jgi:Asp-tRNA(Asn)/Glu-tRNA(Gln) amidotransferase A subunit family amidase
LLILVSLLLVSCQGAAPEAAATQVSIDPQPTDVPGAAPQAQVPDPTALSSNPWQWAAFTSPVEQFDVEMPAAYLLNFAEDGTPHGVVFVGGFLSEPQLLAVGYAYEQTAQARKEPDIDATLHLIEAIDYQ